MKSIVLFDFFGVICSEIAPFWLRRHFDGAEADAVKDDVVAAGDLGRLSEVEVFRRLSALTGVAPEQILREWEEYISIDGALVGYIESLRASTRVYLLSNAIGPFLRRILESQGLYRLFDGVFISSELGLAKPDPEFFREVLSRISASACDAVMIDDNPKNIAGAREAGIDGIVYTSLKALTASQFLLP